MMRCARLRTWSRTAIRCRGAAHHCGKIRPLYQWFFVWAVATVAAVFELAPIAQQQQHQVFQMFGLEAVERFEVEDLLNLSYRVLPAFELWLHPRPVSVSGRFSCSTCKVL